MSALIRPAHPGDRDEVTELLHRHMSAKIPRERWALLFDYPWRPADAPDCGRVLEEDGRIVGYLGATYVDRSLEGEPARICKSLEGEPARICNMSSWYLLHPYRGQGHGRAMMLDLTANAEVTYTDLTATPQVHDMLLAHAGFSVLDRERWTLARPKERTPTIRLQEVAPAAPPFSHHAEMRDLHFLKAETASGSCSFAVQVKRKGEGIAYHQLLHADRPVILAGHAQAIAAALLPDQAAVLAIDQRLAPHPPVGAELEPIAQPRLYKSRRLRPDQIDNLYNEVLLLDQKLP